MHRNLGLRWGANKNAVETKSLDLWPLVETRFDQGAAKMLFWNEILLNLHAMPIKFRSLELLRKNEIENIFRSRLKSNSDGVMWRLPAIERDSEENVNPVLENYWSFGKFWQARSEL